jgi:hypothetical protein
MSLLGQTVHGWIGPTTRIDPQRTYAHVSIAFTPGIFNQGQAVSGLTVGLALLTQINAPGDSGYLITKIL